MGAYLVRANHDGIQLISRIFNSGNVIPSDLGHFKDATFEHRWLDLIKDVDRSRILIFINLVNLCTATRRTFPPFANIATSG